MSEKKGFLANFLDRLKQSGQDSKSQAEEATEIMRLRRRLVLSSVAGVLGVNFFMFLRFFFPRALFEPKTVFVVGYPSDFGFGVDTRFQQADRIWVVRNAEGVFAIFARCTHLG